MAWTRILCAVDFSTCSHVALEQAALLSASCKATLVVAHVYAAPPPETLKAQMLSWRQRTSRLR
jgi:hypothetical protein